jgi:hypothetical protein
VTLLRTQLYLGLDATAVTAAALAAGLGGRRVRGLARVPLAPGALAPSPSGPNLLRGEEVREAVRRAAADAGGGRATLVLPDGVARIALVDLPAGADPRDFVRFRLATSLPWPASDTIVDALPAGRGRTVGAAVRRATVEEYEQAASAAGLVIERVHLAPLLALEGLMRSGARDAVHAVLGDVAWCLASFLGGVPASLRSRRRDRSPGEGGRLWNEASRAALAAGNGTAPVRLVVSGSEAARLQEEIGEGLAERGLAGRGEERPGPAEAAWVGGLLA